jgi:RNA polymerase sigma-70 factor (ECF subfamily)
VAVLPAAGPDPERVTMAREAVARVRREVVRLPRRQREVFVLRFFAGLELEAIAAALAIDLGTVKTHLHRAVHRVRRVAEEALP